MAFIQVPGLFPDSVKALITRSSFNSFIENSLKKKLVLQENTREKNNKKLYPPKRGQRRKRF